MMKTKLMKQLSLRKSSQPVKGSVNGRKPNLKSCKRRKSKRKLKRLWNLSNITNHLTISLKTMLSILIIDHSTLNLLNNHYTTNMDMTKKATMPTDLINTASIAMAMTTTATHVSRLRLTIASKRPSCTSDAKRMNGKCTKKSRDASSMRKSRGAERWSKIGSDVYRRSNDAVALKSVSSNSACRLSKEHKKNNRDVPKRNSREKLLKRPSRETHNLTLQLKANKQLMRKKIALTVRVQG